MIWESPCFREVNLANTSTTRYQQIQLKPKAWNSFWWIYSNAWTNIILLNIWRSSEPPLMTLMKWISTLFRDIENSPWKAKMCISDSKLSSISKTTWKVCQNYSSFASTKKPRSPCLPGLRKNSRTGWQICRIGMSAQIRLTAASTATTSTLGSSPMTTMLRRRQSYSTWNPDRLLRCGKRSKLRMLKTIKKCSRKSMLPSRISIAWDIRKTLWRTMLIFISETSQSMKNSRATSKTWGRTSIFTRVSTDTWSATLS